MDKVKLSTLSSDQNLMVSGEEDVISVSEILENLDNYKDKEIYTAESHRAGIDAIEVMDNIIENIHCNGMYDGWDELIIKDITNEDVEKLQTLFDDILSRRPGQNTSYTEDKLIIIDM